MKSGGLYREYVRAFYQGNNGFAANYDLLFDKIKVWTALLYDFISRFINNKNRF